MTRNRKRQSQPRPLARHVRTRAGLVFIIILGLMVVLMGRIIYINRNKGEDYNKRILEQMQYSSSTIEATRGLIMDRNGTVLAYNIDYYNLIIEPANIYPKEKDETDNLDITAKAISDCFYDATDGDDALTYDRVVQLIKDNRESSRKYYLILKTGISEDQKKTYEAYIEDYKQRQSVKKAKENGKEAETKSAEEIGATITVSDADDLKGSITGTYFEAKPKRFYPYGSLASNVIGFSNNSGGVCGLEKSYNELLAGTNGRKYGYLNDNSSVDIQTVAAKDGYTIVSTIDSYIQKVCERALKSYEKKVGSNISAIVVMNPNNAEILAMATSKTYDLNSDRVATEQDVLDIYSKKEYNAMSEEEKQQALSEATLNKWSNFCVSGAYEPGSVAKSFTVAAALEEGTAKSSSTYYCNGSGTYDGATIHCHLRRGHGTVTLTGSLMASCNDALMQIGDKLGAKKFAKFQQLFGIGQLTGVDLPDEASCQNLYYTADNMSAVSLATNSFGQNFYMTMVQMCAGYCSLVNGGYYYQPHAVKQIIDSEGNVVENVQPVLMRQTISHSTSEFIKDALFQTVEKGTGNAVRIEGYEIGGKTGTAEKNDVGSTKKELYTVSFMATAPAYDPEVIVYVVVDEPNCSKSQNSVQAKPIAKKVLKQILPYLNIYPSSDDDVTTANGDYTDSKYEENDAGGITVDDLRDAAEDAQNTFNNN